MYRFIILLVLLSLFITCKKKYAAPTLREPLTFYFRATINGQYVNWEVKERLLPELSPVTPLVAYSAKSNDCSKWCMDYLCGTTFQRNLPQNGLVKNQARVFYSLGTKKDNIAVDKVLPFFQPGSASFGSDRLSADETPQNGFVILFSDSTGAARTSGIRWGSQAGYSFEIIEIKDAPPHAFYKKAWKAKFSCRLFNKTVDYIELKDGELFGPLME